MTKRDYSTANLRMCMNCHFSKCYASSTNIQLWFCDYHKVTTHYNHTCQNFTDTDESKILNRLDPRFPRTPSSPNYDNF